MSKSVLEHVNLTVSDPKATANMLCDLFDWQIRWSGDAKLGGVTYHVGEEDTYLAIYTLHGHDTDAAPEFARVRGGLNHIGVLVEDLSQAEQRVIAAGFKPHSHGDYEPGRRFYFDDADGIEYAIVSYA